MKNNGKEWGAELKKLLSFLIMKSWILIKVLILKN